jgi:hypothetical protein
MQNKPSEIFSSNSQYCALISNPKKPEKRIIAIRSMVDFSNLPPEGVGTNKGKSQEPHH